MENLFDQEILSEREVPVEQIHRLLRVATICGQIQPTLCGASLDYIGVQPILDGVARYLPSPLDRPAVEGKHPNPKKSDQLQRRKPSVDEPMSGLVFKIQIDQHAYLCFFRVYSGTLKSGSRVWRRAQISEGDEGPGRRDDDTGPLQPDHRDEQTDAGRDRVLQGGGNSGDQLLSKTEPGGCDE